MKRAVMFLFLLPLAFALGAAFIASSQESAVRPDVQSIAVNVFSVALVPSAVLLAVDWASAGFVRGLRVSLCAIMGLILGGVAGVFLGELVLTVAPALMVLAAVFSLITSYDWRCLNASVEA